MIDAPDLPGLTPWTEPTDRASEAADDATEVKNIATLFSLRAASPRLTDVDRQAYADLAAKLSGIASRLKARGYGAGGAR